MQIQLNQNDIETAVRNYVSAMGITRQVDEIQFSVSRKGGQSIEAEIDLADCTGAARPPKPAEATVTRSTEPNTPAPQPASDDEAPAAASAEPDQTSHDSDETPSDDEPAAEGKSLFS